MIRTQRLTLVPLSMEHLHTTHRYASDAEHTRYMMFLPNETLSETEAFIRAAEIEAQKTEPSYWEYAIMLGDKHVGGVSMFRLEDAHSAELGWILDRHCMGHGYATEAADGLMKHAHEYWGFRRFIAQCDGENAASTRVMRRLGMKLVGRTGGRKNRSSSEEREELTYEICFE